MSRKNTILIAVLINTGILSVLLIAALSTQEEITPAATVIAEASPQLPQFDEPFFDPSPMGRDPVEIPLIAAAEEPLVHKLPPIVAEPEPASAPTIAVAAPSSVAPSFAPMNEVAVKKGDNLEKIAKIHNTTVDEIIKLNHLPSSFLKVGQILKIPSQRSLASSSKPTEKKALEMGPEYYTMKVGDNPWAIAMKHHIKVDELLRLNGLNEERARKLKPGDRLRIR